MAIYIIAFQVKNDNRREALVGRLLNMQAKEITETCWIGEHTIDADELCKHLVGYANGMGDVVCVIHATGNVAITATNNKHLPEIGVEALLAKPRG